VRVRFVRNSECMCGHRTVLVGLGVPSWQSGVAVGVDTDDGVPAMRSAWREGLGCVVMGQDQTFDDIDGLHVDDVSGVYETPPWPPPGEPGAVDQDPYYNLAVKAWTSLDPHDLLTETQLIEAAFGRDRARETRWGPRSLDIDLLVVGDRQLDTPELTLPHPRIAERAFVLVPLLEVWPGGALPDGRPPGSRRNGN
jgi:2-amino-4-hydroxy-6-hydroxymethyldihydropteridine diphosphokinase